MTSTKGNHSFSADMEDYVEEYTSKTSDSLHRKFMDEYDTAMHEMTSYISDDYHKKDAFLLTIFKRTEIDRFYGILTQRHRFLSSVINIAKIHKYSQQLVVGYLNIHGYGDEIERGFFEFLKVYYDIFTNEEEINKMRNMAILNKELSYIRHKLLTLSLDMYVEKNDKIRKDMEAEHKLLIESLKEGERRFYALQKVKMG
jgi:hypothetical protein